MSDRKVTLREKAGLPSQGIAVVIAASNRQRNDVDEEQPNSRSASNVRTPPSARTSGRPAGRLSRCLEQSILNQHAIAKLYSERDLIAPAPVLGQRSTLSNG
ncbi:hypothetical protein CTRI78_v007155 [Colletotrichum trifolii]|uniref:Uncharacterized protein n=1 Tax=Colletotrichum trifolii TaxID=5466 RepID=A0A4R8RA41_COLTR|nr:hypothetical protein CTRI78_v007155 [Colletotrichum trifolii]